MSKNERRFTELCSYSKPLPKGLKSLLDPSRLIKPIQTRLLAPVQIEAEPILINEAEGFRTSRWIGTYTYEQTPYCILPRIGIAVFSEMVRHISANLNLTQAPGIGTHMGVGFMQNILAIAWVNSFIRSVSQHGLTKDYIPRHVPKSRYLKGRFEVTEQIRDNWVDQSRIACSYSELTCDTHINRSILQVINHLHRHRLFPFNEHAATHLNVARLLRWREKLLELGVSSIISPLKPEIGVRWGRHNALYRHTLELGFLLLSGGTDFQTGNTRLKDAFFVDSAEIWEMFLLHRLREILKKQNTNELNIVHPMTEKRAMQYMLAFEKKRLYGLIPDYVLYNEELPVAILDAKYKELYGNDPAREDVQQMFIYQHTYLGRNEAPIPSILFYPSMQSTSETKGINTELSIEKEAYTPEGTLRTGQFCNHTPLAVCMVPLRLDNRSNQLDLKIIEKTLLYAIEWIMINQGKGSNRLP